jgi:isopentenyl diphosphate isomerase/L-lactate dehydrogenase-like FMN-dependent dehydrogenase
MAFGNVPRYNATLEIKPVGKQHLCIFIDGEIVIGMDMPEALDVGEKLVALARLYLTGGGDVVE